MISASFARNDAGREHLLVWLAFFLAAVSFCSAVAGAVAVFAREFTIALSGHLLAAVTGGAAGVIADRRRLGIRIFPWAMAFTMPLFGGSAAYFLLETMKKPPAGKLLEEYAEYLNDAAAYRESVQMMSQAPPADPFSLGDVLSNPSSDAEQRVAIEYLEDMETQAACDVLRKAATSAGREAWFLAVTAMTHMEEKMLERLVRLENALKKHGESQADVVLLLKTAATYIDFIYYNFAAGERRSEYLCSAEKLLNVALARHSTGEKEVGEALILLGRVKLAQKDGMSAAQCFDRYLEHNPERSLGYLWRAEAWYSLGNYQRLREDCKAASEAGGIPGNMRAVLDLWLPEKTGKDMAVEK